MTIDSQQNIRFAFGEKIWIGVLVAVISAFIVYAVKNEVIRAGIDSNHDARIIHHDRDIVRLETALERTIDQNTRDIKEIRDTMNDLLVHIRSQGTKTP